MKTVVLTLMALVLTGCGTWNAGQPVAVNWYKVGYSEAKAGYTANWRNNYHTVRGGAPEHFNADDYHSGFHAALKTCDADACHPQPLLADRVD